LQRLSANKPDFTKLDKMIASMNGLLEGSQKPTVNVNIKDTKNAHILDTTLEPIFQDHSVWFSGFLCASLVLPA